MGKVGRVYLRQLERTCFFSTIKLLDQKVKYVNQIKVQTLESIFPWEDDYFVIAISNPNVVEQIRRDMIERGIPDSQIIVGC